MYSTIVLLHSWARWLLLLFLIYSIYRAYIGYSKNKVFSKRDNSIRHWTATVSHVQLVLGIFLYTKSPVTRFFLQETSVAINHMESLFFGLIHATLMLTAIVLITVGSSMAKRKLTDREKYRTMLIWFGVALVIIFIAIPWPFSPLANRPFINTTL